MSNSPQNFYQFGPFQLDPVRPRLTRGGEIVALTPKALELLLALIQQGGKVVEKDELMRRIWPDTFVEESNLSVHVFALRKALGETTEGQSYIETVPRQGYRFTATVQDVSANRSELVVERRTLSRVTIEEHDAISEAGDFIVPIASNSPPLLTVSEPNIGLKATHRRNWGMALIATVALAAVLLGVLYYARQSGGTKRPAASHTIKSIAVLPLRPIGPESQSENYLGVGLADALITRLGGIGELNVRPTSAVLRFDNARQDSLAIARALGVDAILEGSYQHEGQRVRVSVQLVSAKEGTQLWAGTFDDEFKNIFAVQDSVSREVAEALVANLSDAEQRFLAERPTVNVEAYQAYLKGRYFWNKRTEEGFTKAVDYFKQAIEKDGNFALAYAGLGDTYGLMGQRGHLRTTEAYPKAGAAASKALELDETLAEGHVTLAFVKEQFYFDWPGAERHYQRAIELNPAYAYAYGVYGMHLVQHGRFDESLALLKRAEELDPLSPSFAVYLGWHYHFSRRYDQAIAQSAKALELDPGFLTAHSIMGAAYEQKGNYDEAVAHYLKRFSNPDTTAQLNQAYKTGGMRGYRLQLLKQITGESRRGELPTYSLAELHAALGNKDQALTWLEKSYEERAGGITFIKVLPAFDGLRSEPRFADLLRRVGFAQNQ